MSTITTEFGSGGTHMTPHGSDGPTIATALRDVADDLAALKGAMGITQTGGDGVVEGLRAEGPTTPSSQLTGTGNTTWNAGDIDAGWVCLDGVFKKFAAQTSFSIHASSFLTGLTSGKSCIAAIVCKNVTGTITMVAVKGTPATTGSQVAPTSAEIQAAVGAGNHWAKVMECTLNRTGDTTVTESRDLTKRDLSSGLGSTSGVTLATVKG